MGDRLPSADTVRALLRQRHPDAAAAFWAGSLSRGEGTPTSDIDLVIVFPELDHAWRETVEAEGRLVEMFFHDPASLDVFFAKDVDRGHPTLMAMVADGIDLIPGPLATTVRARARAVLDAGPRPWNAAELEGSRYGAGDLLDDLSGATDRAEIQAIGVWLYGHVFEHHRRARGRWSASGKQIVRMLRQEEGAFGRRFLAAFDALFERAEKAGVVDLVDEIYAPDGGVLRHWRQDAPPHRGG
ncbi:MAG: nucleotidyltransferase domain-containing protein [Pseudomonadota bacterium]